MEGQVEEDSATILGLLQLLLLSAIFITLVEVGPSIQDGSVEEWDEGFVLKPSV